MIWCGSSKLNAAEFRCWRPFLGQQRFVWRGLRTALSIPETRKRACLPRSRRESRMVKIFDRFEKARLAASTSLLGLPSSPPR
jgi:hypothetical protein